MSRYSRLISLSAVAVISILAIIVFAYAAKDVLVAAGIAINQTVFIILVVAVLIGVYVYFVKLARTELKRLSEEARTLPPEE